VYKTTNINATQRLRNTYTLKRDVLKITHVVSVFKHAVSVLRDNTCCVKLNTINV